MSLFNFILEKLGIGRAAAEAPNANQSAPASAPVAAIAVVNVVTKLEGLAASSAEKRNWKVSIVDLLKLLGLDSSLTARKELVTELGCSAQAMADLAQMNIWLHKTVLQKLAQNGGNIPQELLN